MKRRAPQSELGMALRRAFARNVRQFRRQKGMTQNELACAAGLGRCFVSQIERGRFSATLELQEIADRLGLSRKTLWEKKKKWQL